ncbi:TetR/AcrR family transcriptional regulator [Streptomyces sp. NBC_01476]|uniref:TetR/AcrR family transcriptional regulator n=1 Tax=Streptomyces sp. NBC_01476 TaxID=2903881 RepID=UPI002E32CA32|nr:helix-turn-helix domain-containing protein [Streptomyces sp. NBC_01476]
MPKRSTYHHGDLKAVLVATALEVIAEQGIPALTVAEVARRAEVSSAAPYRHFASRQALLIACAIAAARQLTRELHQAQAAVTGPDGTADPVESASAAAAAYARFAAEHGSGFDLIFADELQGADSQDLLDAGRGVMDAMLPAALQITGGDGKSALNLLERQIAGAQGYATLLRTGFLRRRHATVDDIAAHAAAIARSLSHDAQRATPDA